MRTFVLTLFVGLLAASSASADVVLTGRVTDLLGRPLPHARVHVLSGSEYVTAETDGEGRYRVQLEGRGDVKVVIGAGKEHTFRRGTIKQGTVQQFDVEVEISDGEIIRIIDSKPAAVPPKPISDVRIAPPYSEEAIVRDAWAKAWFLLDIDETGKVARLKLLRRPGFGLDQIAADHAFKQRFSPALDGSGKPMRSRILWSIEWPAHGWLTEYAGVATRIPAESYDVDPLQLGFGGVSSAQVTDKIFDALADNKMTNHGEVNPVAPMTGPAPLGNVRCAGTGPLSLDHRYPVYRDCSRPDVSRIAKLSWYDGVGPLPADPVELLPLPEPPVVIRKRHWVARTLTGSAALALTGAAVFSFLRQRHFGDLVNGEFASYTRIDYDAYNDAVASQKRWMRITFASGFAAAGAIGIAAFTWFGGQRTSSFSVQPDGGGASASYARGF